MNLTFRNAERKDTLLILQFIKEFADYEKMLNEVVADETTLETWIFDKQTVEVIFALEDGKEVGFALFFPQLFYVLRTSRYLFGGSVCQAGMLRERLRKSYSEKLASIAVERGCGRLEWWCLDWNKPSIDFYLSLGAEAMSDWTVYRIVGDTLIQLAE